jgi:1,2-diacylglycerol 3-alpha-glucosyltransferase
LAREVFNYFTGQLLRRLVVSGLSILVFQSSAFKMIPKQTRVAVLFSRFGPYHHARLKAAGARLQVTGVEFSNVDTTYAWDLVEGADGFNRLTLFSGMAVNELPASRIFNRVGQALDQLQPQVVAIPGWYDRCSMAALRWCGSHGIPVVVMSETTAWDVERKWLKETMKRRLMKLCAAGLVGGRAHADYLEQLGIERTKIFFGYDAVDNEYFQTKADEIRKHPPTQSYGATGKVESRNKYGLPERYFLASARFIEKKNLPRLLQAFARYRELAAKVENRNQPGEVASQRLHGPGKAEIWDLVLLGDGPLKSDLCHLISDLRLDACVHLPGFKQYDELPVYYSLASAFVHASATEQWGLVVNEAMASGLPVLVSNRCGCAQDLVQEGKNGFTFDPYNVEQLAQLMLKLSPLNPEKGRGPHGALRPQLSAFGSESHRIISQWGPERFAKGLHDAVQTVLKNPASNASLMDRLILRLLMAK